MTREEILQEAYNRGFEKGARHGAMEKLAYGTDYLPEVGTDMIGLLERAYAEPTEEGLSEFRKQILQAYPAAKQLKLHYDRYDSSKGVDILRRRNLAKALQALAAARTESENAQFYTDKDEIPFFDLQFRAKTPEHRQWLQDLRSSWQGEDDLLAEP